MNKTEGSSPGTHLVFLKLGGSLITDKQSPRTSRLEVIQRICSEIKTALAEDPGLRILLGLAGICRSLAGCFYLEPAGHGCPD